MKEVILHIGHGKTGTSYIQSALSLNQGALEKLGIIYPYSDSFSQAKVGRISSGNGEILVQDSFGFSITGKTLLSSEILFFSLLLDNKLETYVLDKVDKLTVILYVRDVLEMLTSSWGQFVKRSGETRLINEFFLDQKDHIYDNVLQWINISKKYDFKLIIRNYSSHKDEVLEDFISVILGDSNNTRDIIKTFALPPVKTVNRSMTNIEYTIIRMFNKIDKSFAQNLADTWVNFIPDIESEIPKFTVERFATLCGQYHPLIEKINSNLPEGEKIKFGDESRFVDSEKNTAAICDYQIQLFSEQFSRNFSPPNRTNKEFNFCAKTYLVLNPDIKAANVNPYEHYLTTGIHEGRRIK
jgi:hypothetical protein